MQLAAVCRERGHSQLTSVRTELAQDIRRYWGRSGIAADRALTPWRCASALADPAIACLLLHRVAHWAQLARIPGLPGLLAACNRHLFKITISPVSCVAGGWSIRHPAGVHFHAVAGQDLTLFAYASVTADEVPVGDRLDRAPTLGSRVRLGADAAIIGPVTIGDDVDLGFRAVVAVDIASDSIVVTDASRLRLQKMPLQTPDDPPLSSSAMIK